MITFDICPFVGAGPLNFGMRPEQVELILGLPRLSRKNPIGETEQRYESVVARYDPHDHTLCEISFTSKSDVRFCGVSVFDDRTGLEKMFSIEDGAVEALGFIVFPHLGIALADFFSEQESDRAITVYARGRWTDLKGFKPFILERDRP